MKIKKTTRKFYNKWDYKVSFFIKGLGYMPRLTIDEAKKRGKSQDVIDMIEELEKFDSSKYTKRIESNIIDLYTNDRDFFDYFLNKFSSFVRLACELDDDHSELLKNSHTIVAKKYPYDMYHYKIFLKPHKFKSLEEKRKYLDWLETQKPNINITDNVKEWFYKTDWNWDRRYMYVKDDKTLLMLKLKNSEALGTVYSYVISDK
jgi:hypothetical protein